MILKFSENSRRLRWSASLPSDAVDVDAEALAQHVLPAGLVAARHPDEQPALEHVVGDRDLLREADRIVRRQHEAELAVHEALRVRARGRC